jgi:three-Cys-motif partner protein
MSDDDVEAMPAEFFEEQEEQSAVKAAIVVDYFVAWSRIMAGHADKIAYVDLYAGPGRYGTGQLSTPLLILQRAIESDTLRPRLVAIFNDADEKHVQALQREISALPGIETLAHTPEVLHSVVSDEQARQFEEMNTVPVLGFIDPWGYKGLSLRLIRGMIKDWGCEAIFFFNYNRINMGIRNNRVEPHMVALFGDERLTDLQGRLPSLTPREREIAITTSLGEAIDQLGAPFLIPFGFRREDGRLSHFICFVSKHKLGYSIMKEVMASHGVVDDDGVPKFEYLPASGGRQLAFGDERPILKLAEDLRREFAGRKMTVRQIVDEHNVGTQFIARNYKRVLREMEAAGEVACDPDAQARKKNTLADRVMVSFPAASA